MNISSDSLFHFTKKLDSVLSIVENGFRYNYLEEEIPFSGYPSSPFSNPGIIKYINFCTAICFCDVPFNLINEHRSQYGSYVIGLKKDWGIKNGITPIRYIHYYSPDINNDKYRQLKDSFMMYQQHDYVPLNFYLRVLKDLGRIEKIPSEKEILDLPTFALESISMMNAQLLEMAENILFSQGFLRAYEGEWTDRETNKKMNRTFYNEREWRIIQTKEDENYLPFAFGDINHIMVLKKSEKDSLCNLLIEHFKLSNDDKNEVWYKVKIWKDFEKDFIGL